MKSPNNPAPMGLNVEGLSPEELGALSELRQWDGWKTLVKVLSAEAARVRRDMYDPKLDDTPVTLGRLMGRMEILEKVLGTPGRANHKLQQKQEKQK